MVRARSHITGSARALSPVLNTAEARRAHPAAAPTPPVGAAGFGGVKAGHLAAAPRAAEWRQQVMTKPQTEQSE
jgi:hypothetical protein